MENSFGDSTVDDTSLTNRMGKKKLIKKKQSPLEPNPKLEDWVDNLKIDLYKGAPLNFNNGAGLSNNPRKLSSPHLFLMARLLMVRPHTEIKSTFFDEDTFEFSITPETSPILFEHWEVSDSEVDFDWEKYEDCTKATKTCCRK